MQRYSVPMDLAMLLFSMLSPCNSIAQLVSIHSELSNPLTNTSRPLESTWQ